jgi:hypothetical protein
MAKRLSREEKNQKMVRDLINKMFEIAGHNVTYDDIKDRKDEWFTEWTMTMEQNNEWKKWGREYLKKEMKIWPKLVEREMEMISLMWGLKFSDFDENKL